MPEMTAVAMESVVKIIGAVTQRVRALVCNCVPVSLMPCGACVVVSGKVLVVCSANNND